MKRGQPPRRKTPIKRSTKRIKLRRGDPAKRRWASHRCLPYLAWLAEQPCAITGARTGEWLQCGVVGGHPWYVEVVVDPAHGKARGTGADDLYVAIPLAHHLHVEQHAQGIKTFQRKYDFDWPAAAKEYTERFLELYPQYREAAA